VIAQEANELMSPFTQTFADSEIPQPGEPHWYPKVSTPARVPILAPAALSEDQLEQILTGNATFSFHFQPIVDLQRGSAVGFEALARFSVAENRIPPNLVFEAAGTYGRRLDLEEKVLTEAIAANRLLPPNTFLSVNVGPGYLLSDRFDRVLAEAHSLRGVVFEITEDEVITDYSILHKKLALIRDRGGFAAVDDAGSGYSSLKHIMEIRPNFIKLDRSFINGCNTEPAKAVLIDMIGKAANRLDAWIIAEGIENADELDELIRLTVPLGQGFYLARPEPAMRLLPADQIASIVSRVEVQVPTAGIQRAVENCLVCGDRSEAHFRLRSQSPGGVAAVCDSDRQPIEIIEHHPLLGLRSLPQVMKVQESSEGVEILHRALTRPSHLRFDPIVVVNERGALVGVVHLDRLVREVISF
jgi:EAL domain-containing protein (putative c-di-GMP-specific phosphodiesterase class I)